MSALNWKTTALGIGGAILYAIWPMIEGGTTNIKELILAATLAAIGYFSKDKDISGVGADAIRPVQP